jgi:hypothetical protein
MKKNLKIIKLAELGKAGASVFSKLAIDDAGTLIKEKPKPKKVEVKPVEVKKPIVVKKPEFNMAKHDSIAKEHMKTDPKFKATIDSLKAVHKADSLAIDKEYKSQLRDIAVSDSLRRDMFVQDSTNYGGIIARIKRTLGL